MNEIDVAELRKLLAAETPENTARCSVRLTEGGIFLGTDLYLGDRFIAGVSYGDEPDQGFALIVAAVNALPAILDELDRGRKLMEVVRQFPHGHGPKLEPTCLKCNLGFIDAALAGTKGAGT